MNAYELVFPIYTLSYCNPCPTLHSPLRLPSLARTDLMYCTVPSTLMPLDTECFFSKPLRTGLIGARVQYFPVTCQSPTRQACIHGCSYSAHIVWPRLQTSPSRPRNTTQTAKRAPSRLLQVLHAPVRCVAHPLRPPNAIEQTCYNVRACGRMCLRWACESVTADSVKKINSRAPTSPRSVKREESPRLQALVLYCIAPIFFASIRCFKNSLTTVTQTPDTRSSDTPNLSPNSRLIIKIDHSKFKYTLFCEV